MPLPVPEESETELFEDAVETNTIDPPVQATAMPGNKEMPSPYARDAPKFDSEKPEELNRYIRRLEELFVKYGVESDKEKIRYLGAYTDARTEKEWEAMASFEGNNFEEHKKEIIDSYPEASSEARGSMKELKRVRDSFSGITCQDLTKLQAYKRAFVAEAKKLQKNPALLSNHEAIDYFMKPLSSGFRKKIIDKLDLSDLLAPATADANRRIEDRFPLEKVIETAVNIARGMQNSYGTSESSSSSNSDNDNKRDLRALVKQENEEINATLAQLQDYQKLSEKNVISALSQLKDNLQQVIQAQNSQQAVPVYQNQGYQPPAQAARPRSLYVPAGNTSTCFYCGEDGHMKDDCPHRNQHAEKGWIVIDARGRHTLPDGRMIPLSGGPTAKLRVENLNGAGPKTVASNIQNLIGKPGVIQLNQTIAIPGQLEIENELEKFDLNDIVQFISTRSGQKDVMEELQSGFNKVR